MTTETQTYLVELAKKTYDETYTYVYARLASKAKELGYTSAVCGAKAAKAANAAMYEILKHGSDDAARHAAQVAALTAERDRLREALVAVNQRATACGGATARDRKEIAEISTAALLAAL